MLPIPDRYPLWFLLLDCFTELPVLAPRTGQDADEPTSLLMDVLHRLVVAELRVGHIEKVFSTRYPAKRIPGFFVAAGVAGVARLAAELYGHASVTAGREDEQKLLEIGAMILGVPVGDEGGALAPQAAALGLPVLATEMDGCGVVVQFIEDDPKGLSDSHDHLGEEGSTVCLEESVQCATDDIVVEVGALAFRQAKSAWVKGSHGLLLAVDGLALDQQRTKQNPEGMGGRDPVAPIGGGNETFEQGVEAEAFDECVDEWQRSEALGVEREFGRGIWFLTIHILSAI
jgi:hypothetical protein